MTVVQSDVKNQENVVKCLVWDLDNTLWSGVVLEGDEVFLDDETRRIIKTLDERGILQAIASKNDYQVAVRKLESMGIFEYFLYPQINWNAKSSSIKRISESLNIGLDAIAFIDDQEFEREEVNYTLPKVLCLDAGKVPEILNMPEFCPRFITSESKMRRRMYLSDIRRKKAEEEFVDTDESFLATLNMVFRIKPAEESDLQRAEELTVRTNQLNTTGYTYSYDELNKFRCSKNHRLLVATLDDKYGPYGTIGLALVHCSSDVWTLKLLLMSCRVMSRGVGSIMLSYIMREAKRAGARMFAEFLPNDRNRMMYITFKFGGFRQREYKNDIVVLEHNLKRIQPYPDYVALEIDE